MQLDKVRTYVINIKVATVFNTKMLNIFFFFAKNSRKNLTYLFIHVFPRGLSNLRNSYTENFQFYLAYLKVAHYIKAISFMTQRQWRFKCVVK